MLNNFIFPPLTTGGDTITVDPTVLKQLESKFEELFYNMRHNSVDFIWSLLEIIFIFIAAKFLLRFISYLTKRVMSSEKYHRTEQNGKRVDSLMTLLRSAARYIIYFIAFFMALDRLGLKETSGLLLTAGVGSVAIGFGAQSLVKDVVTGFFLMFENQFSVGDYVKINNTEGYVDAIAIRVTYVKAYTGEKIIIPNGSIANVINYSRGSQRAAVIVPISYDYPIKKVMENINLALSDFAIRKAEIILEPPSVQVINSFENTHYTIKVVCMVKTLKHWEAQREIMQCIKEQFEQAEIKFPVSFMFKMDQATPKAANESVAGMEPYAEESTAEDPFEKL